MDNKISTYSPAFSIVSWVALIGGIVTYLLGLWNAEMQLNEKGYYFAVLVLGLFSAASYQKTVRDKYEGIPTTPIYYMTCLTVFIISVALLLVGLWNATLLLSEKGFYGLGVEFYSKEVVKAYQTEATKKAIEKAYPDKRKIAAWGLKLD